MALALTVDKIDSVPEALRGEYTEKDGKFHLNVEGLEDTAGLKSALKSEREANKANKTEVAAWKALGKTPTEISELVAAKEKEAEEALKKAGNFDDVLKQHLTKAAKERADSEAKLTGERDAAINSERSAVIEARLSSALTKSKATAAGLELLTERLGKRIKFETEDGKRVTTIMSADGKVPMVGSGEGGLATYDDLVKEAVKSYPELFEATGAGGSGTDSKGQRRDVGGKIITRKDFDALSPLDRHAKIKAGFKLVD